MHDLKNIITEIKTILAQKQTGKIYDKHVAQALRISQAALATMKKRNTIPHEAIFKFCIDYKVDANLLFKTTSTVKHKRYTVRYFKSWDDYICVIKK